MKAKTLMVMGTSSSAGKSLLTAALCRCFSRRGILVAPFKAQNMSNNAAVCADGTEIGRSQALQALAAGVPPCSDMNPILLKPEGDSRSQVIVNGRPLETLDAADYFQRRAKLWPHVTSALDRLRCEFDLVVIEGAGSPAELNLSDVEIVNMSVARYCRSPVVLVGDIERGGVFAQLLGTLWLLEPDDRALICGLIVNKFRGDLSLFDRGVELLEQRGGVPVLGVLPWIDALHLPEEDAVALSALMPSQETTLDDSKIDIAVIHFPHISNFDDFDLLLREPCVNLRYVRSADRLGKPDVVILPGTKNTIGDLEWLKSTGMATQVQQCVQSGVQVVGICGGYQMLGNDIHNPHCVETNAVSARGLGMLDIETTFYTEKQTRQIQMRLIDEAVVPGLIGETLSGYEIHSGRTNSRSSWLARIETDNSSNLLGQDGAHSRHGQVWGCYLHGLFDNDPFRSAWLRKLGATTFFSDSSSGRASIELSLDRLADAFEKHVDFDQIMKLTFHSNLPLETQYAG